MLMSQGQWFYAVGGRQGGPVAWDVLRQMADARQVQPHDLVWQEGMANWQPAASVQGLFVAGAPASAAGAAPADAAAHSAPDPRLGYYTPEHRGPRYAGFWIRFVAAILDGIILYVGSACAGGLLGGILGGVMGASGAPMSNIELAAQILGSIVGIVVAWLYEALMTCSEKQGTLGKMAVGVVVVGEDGGPISFARATGRHFAKVVSYLTLLVGFMMAGWTQRKQALHDLMAKTYVVYRAR